VLLVISGWLQWRQRIDSTLILEQVQNLDIGIFWEYLDSMDCKNGVNILHTNFKSFGGGYNTRIWDYKLEGLLTCKCLMVTQTIQWKEIISLKMLSPFRIRKGIRIIWIVLGVKKIMILRVIKTIKNIPNLKGW
jgi:hypothetical protein